MNKFKEFCVNSKLFRWGLNIVACIGIFICMAALCSTCSRTGISIEGFDKNSNIVVGKGCDVELGSLPENCITISYDSGSYRCKINEKAEPVYYKVNDVNPNLHNIEREITVVTRDKSKDPIPPIHKDSIEANLRGIETTYIRLADYLKKYHNILYNSIQTLLYRNDEDDPWKVILLDDNVSVDGIKYQREKVTDADHVKLECFYINTYKRTPNNDESFTVDGLSPKVNISAAKTSWGCDFLLIERNDTFNTVNFPKPYMSVKKTEDAKQILKDEGAYTSLDFYNNEKVVPYNLHLTMEKNDLLLEDAIEAGNIGTMLWSKAKLVNNTHIRFFEIGTGTYFMVLIIPILLGGIALLVLFLLFKERDDYFLGSTLPLISTLFFFLFLLGSTIKSFHDTYSEPYIPVYVETLLAQITATIAFPLAVALVNPDAVKISSKRKISIGIAIVVEIVLAIIAYLAYYYLTDFHYHSYKVLGMDDEPHLTIAKYMSIACGVMFVILLLIKRGFFHWIYGPLKSIFNWIYEPIKDKIISISNWIGRLSPVWQFIIYTILTACLGGVLGGVIVVIGAVTRVAEFLSLPVMILLVSWMCKYGLKNMDLWFSERDNIWIKIVVVFVVFLITLLLVGDARVIIAFATGTEVPISVIFFLVLMIACMVLTKYSWFSAQNWFKTLLVYGIAYVLVVIATGIIARFTDKGFLINVISFIIALMIVPWVEPSSDLTSTGIKTYNSRQSATWKVSLGLGALSILLFYGALTYNWFGIRSFISTGANRIEMAMNPYKYNSNPNAKTQQEAEWNAAQYAMKPVGKSPDMLQNIYSPGVASKKNALRSTATNDLSFLSVGRMLGWAGWLWHFIILGLVIALTWFTSGRIIDSKEYNMRNIIPVCTAIVLITSFVVYYLMYWANWLPLTGRPFFGFFALDSPTALISSTIVLAMLAIKDEE